VRAPQRQLACASGGVVCVRRGALCLLIFVRVCVLFQRDCLQPVATASLGSSSSPIPAPFTSRRLYSYDRAAVLMRLLRTGQYARILQPEDRISAAAAPAARVASTVPRDPTCRGVQTNGIVCVGGAVAARSGLMIELVGAQVPGVARCGGPARPATVVAAAAGKHERSCVQNAVANLEACVLPTAAASNRSCSAIC
jgi:hypothetical protein